MSHITKRISNAPMLTRVEPRFKIKFFVENPASSKNELSGMSISSSVMPSD